MKIERESCRPDQTRKLGTDLSDREKECYSFICQNGVTPVATKKIYNEMWWYPGKSMPAGVSINAIVGNMIRGIRFKLGEEAIITRIGFGYLARTQLINYQVAQNFDKSKEK